MNHGNSLFIGSNHPGLDHLARDQFLQNQSGDILVVLRLDVGKVTLDGLEGKREEVSPDLLQAGGGHAGVAPVVEILHVAGLGLVVVGDDLAPVPASLARGRAHGVENDGLRNLSIFN